jgi:hypothetical protein
MKVVIAAILATAAGLIAVSMLGVAAAEAPTTTTPQRTMSVQGVATEQIDQQASAATANAVYRQGMSDAIADGLGKAQLLASKVGATLGPVQSVIEDGGYIGCTGGGESGYVEYEGAQPDFGSPGTSISSVAPRVGAAKPTAGLRSPSVKRRRSHRRPAAKAAAAASCTLSAQVSLVYPLS